MLGGLPRRSRTCALRPHMTFACMSPAKAMSGTLALTTSVSFQLNEKAMMYPDLPAH